MTNMTNMTNIINNERTKKNKDNNSLSSQEKANLWNVFDTEVINPDKPKNTLECLYRVVKDREHCEMCQFSLAVLG